ncbi:uncharacterized protein C8R40DRAFT_1177474 [Lentinula edodes]|uniref:uncharacterized protein n=1 Tax=Lentinula edodes TaxID=5353 RepID=UPI001E8E4854|nr:uncharacterized protein C8R40DRAFT_1177474 [Lentinula edodes]KAH7868741.1 hypothetical protein C8R40DRAFT_1177474 [Lentinula edodes]
MAPSTQDPSHGNNARPDHSSPSSNSTSTVGSKEKRTTATKSDEPSSSILSSFHKVFVNGVPLADYVKEDPHWNLLLDIATPCMECEHKRIECTVPAKYPRCEPCGSSNCSISRLARHRAFARQHGKDLAFSRKFLDEHGATKKDSYTIPLNYWRTYDSLLRKRNHPPEISAEFRIFEQNEDLTTEETSPDPHINESSAQLLSKPSKEKKKVPKRLTEEATPKDTKKGKGWAEETTAKNTKKGKKRSAEESVPPDTNKAKRRLTEESLSKDDETGKGRSAEEALPKDNKKGKGRAVNESIRKDHDTAKRRLVETPPIPARLRAQTKSLSPSDLLDLTPRARSISPLHDRPLKRPRLDPNLNSRETAHDPPSKDVYSSLYRPMVTPIKKLGSTSAETESRPVKIPSSSTMNMNPLTSSLPPMPRPINHQRLQTENEKLKEQTQHLESLLASSRLEISRLTSALKDTTTSLETRAQEVVELRRTIDSETQQKAEYSQVIADYHNLDQAIKGPSSLDILSRFSLIQDSLDTFQRESKERSEEHNKLQEECSLSNKRLCQAQHTLDERNAMAARQQVLIEELNETLQIYKSRASGAESLIQTYYQDSQDPHIPVWQELQEKLNESHSLNRRIASHAHRLHRTDPSRLLDLHTSFVHQVLEGAINLLRRGNQSPEGLARWNKLALEFLESNRHTLADIHIRSLSTLTYFFSNRGDVEDNLLSEILANSRFEDSALLDAAQHAGFADSPPAAIEPPLYHRMFPITSTLPSLPMTLDDQLPAVPNFDQRMVLWDRYLQVYLEALLNGTPLEPVRRILDDPLHDKSHPPAVDTSLPHGGVEPTDVASDGSYVKNLSTSCGGPVPGSPDENIATASSSSVSIVDGPIEEKTVDLSSDNGSLFTP